jgi:N-acetylglucosamine kinase-like BadF-type ATPase
LRVLARDAGGRQRSHTGPSVAAPDLPDALRRQWRRWGLSSPAVRALVVASRGVWTLGERRAATRRLRGLAQRVRVISDVEAAHRGGLGGGTGVLLLAGTGAIALARDRRGRWARAGGLGPLLGDNGSAFAIGRQWLLTHEHWARARRLATRSDAVARIAALAPGIVRRATRGDRGARLVVGQAQRDLARLVADVAGALRLEQPVEVTWAGSLMGNPRFRAGVWRVARSRGVRLVARAPRSSAIEAASRLAREVAR